jgi:hypothetical protein
MPCWEGDMKLCQTQKGDMKLCPTQKRDMKIILSYPEISPPGAKPKRELPLGDMYGISGLAKLHVSLAVGY